VIDVYYIEISFVNPIQPSQQHSSAQRPANIQPTANNDGRGYKWIVKDINGVLKNFKAISAFTQQL
jgi:hypothetical protein